MSTLSVLSFIRPNWNNLISIKDWSTEFIFICIICNIREIKIFRINFIHRGRLYLLKRNHTQQLPLMDDEKNLLRIFQEHLSSMMIESSSNILDLHISQFVRNIAIAERDMLSTVLNLSPR